MKTSLIQRFRADTRFYHEMTRPQSAPTALALLGTALSNRGLWLLTFHRIAFFSTFNRNLRSPLWWIARLFESLGYYLNAVISKSEVYGDCDFNGDVYLSNRGYVICGALSVGNGSVIHDHITFGFAVANGARGRPTFGENVWIGPNCIIAGPLTIGAGATVLPGTYLTYSVPAGAVVKGNPARVIRENFDNSALRASLDVVYELPEAAP